MEVSASYEFLPKTRTLNAAVVMDHFGIRFETGQHLLADRLELPIRDGDIVAFIGESGSGKSSLMRAAAAQLPEARSLPIPDATDDRTLVDILPTPIETSLSLLASCGLGEARLLLRSPRELSDGQRYRFQLAWGVALSPRWLVADEFTAALDRTLARTISFSLRKLATRTGLGFLVATTHDDILEDLQPDVLVRCQVDGPPVVTRRDVKKKTSASITSSNLRPDRYATGRTSLGGITGVTTCRSSDSSPCSGTSNVPSASASSPPRPAACVPGHATSD